MLVLYLYNSGFKIGSSNEFWWLLSLLMSSVWEWFIRIGNGWYCYVVGINFIIMSFCMGYDWSMFVSCNVSFVFVVLDFCEKDYVWCLNELVLWGFWGFLKL